MLKWMAVVALAVSLVGFAGCGELQNLRKQNASLNGQVTSLTADNQKLKNENDALKADNQRLQASMTKDEAAAKRAAGVMADLKAEQEKLRKQKADLMAIFGSMPDLSIMGGAEGNYIVAKNEILFDPGQIELKASAGKALDKVADYLRAHPDLTVRIDGHTDGVPIKESKWQDNYHLSAMRAHAVMKYLMGKGVKADKMFIAGFGPNKPRVPPKSPTEAVEANRRVEILVVPTGIRSINQILEEMKD